MSIKIFGKGLGVSDGTSTSSPVSFGQSSPAVIERDNNVFTTGQQVSQNIDPTMLRTTVQMPGVLGTIADPQPPRLTANLKIQPQVFSAPSGQVPFETLFHEFDLEVFPFYNFWVPDELTNDRDERGDRKIEDLPRFIKVSWLIAPDMPDPTMQVPKRVNRRTIKPIIFGQEIERPNVFRNKGVDFSPAHLQPGGLSSIKGIIANGHLAPGVLETVVDLPLTNAGVTAPSSPNLMDEDIFLNDPTSRGVSAHELRAQQLQVTNGTLQAAIIGRDGISDSVQAQKIGLVDGKFNIVKAQTPGGSLAILGAHSASPVISLHSKTATPSRQDSNDPAADMSTRISQAPTFSAVPKTASTKVKFFDPSIGALVSESKVRLMSAPEHLEAMAAVAPSLPSLELLARSDYYTLPRKFDIPSLPSPRMKPLEYIGYVLEKYRRGPNGVFAKIDEIDMPNREINEYIDTKVLYGETYRYRIKSVLRWTRPANVGVMGKDRTIIPRFGSHTTHLASHQSSYFYSEWSPRWAYGTCMDDQPPLPPDELQVRPESQRGRVVVTFRLPQNDQRDILSMRLFRKLQDENGRDVTDWLPMVHSDGKVDQPPQNVIFYDTNVDFFQSSKFRYVYTAQCISRHGEDSVLSVQLAARLNKDYFSRGEFPVEYVSAEGVRLEYFGPFSKIPFHISKMEMVGTPPAQRIGQNPGVSAFVLTGRDAVGNIQGVAADYVLRAQSLDTGETKDIPFSTVFKMFKTREKFVISPIFLIPAEVEKKGSTGFQSKTPSVIQKALTPYQDPKRLQVVEKRETLPKDRAAPGDRWKR